MKNTKLLRVIIFILFSSFALCLFSCNIGQITYYWYDADGSLLYEEQASRFAKPTNHALPPDSDKWDYTAWKTGNKKTETIACRTPKSSYFAGNVFQIIVKNLGEQPVATGSAFVFNSDGWFVTNAHVMKDAYYAEAIFNIPNSSTGESYTYLDINSGTYYHSDKDIYIGKIENYSAIDSNYNDIPLNLSYTIGEKTYSVGYPNSSIEIAIHEGKVTESWSDLYEKLYSGNSYICSSSFIAHGSSGGILVNDNLEVIGITTLGWTDKNDKFISGAAISAFNFNNLVQNANDNDLITLQERFHKDEKSYIGYFNEAKDDEAIGKATRVYFDDGSFAYEYSWSDSGTNKNELDYAVTKKLTVGTDLWISWHEECCWSSGDRRTISFYGYYDPQNEFQNFIYEFKYTWANGVYYTVTCSKINYSPTLSLTLNNCSVNHSYSYSPTQSNIEYAKQQFNRLYEWLTEDMARFE